jgi:L-amino acid N-acyltransferase YncA
MAVEQAGVTISDLRPGHWPEVARIYADGIATGNATFETEVRSWERWDSTHLLEHRVVALRDGKVVAGSLSSRSRTVASTAGSSRTASASTRTRAARASAVRSSNG